MKKYEAPIAEKVEIEVVNVLLASDKPMALLTWGSSIHNVNTSGANLYR